MTISACLIVRDEEYFIRQCLENLGTYPVDEIIIVDGGSTDGTLDIIREYPEVKLFERPMPFSFSEQRNYVKSLAKSEWILSLDADETLENAHMLLDFKKDDAAIGFSFPTRHVNQEQVDTDPHIRFFRNSPDLNWEREVHEYLVWNGEQLRPHPANMNEQRDFLRWAHEVVVVHWAFTAPAEHLRKKARRYMKYNHLGAGIQISDEEALIPK